MVRFAYQSIIIIVITETNQVLRHHPIDVHHHIYASKITIDHNYH